MLIELDSLVLHLLAASDRLLQDVVEADSHTVVEVGNKFVLERIAAARGQINAARISLLESNVAVKEDLPF